MIALERDPSIVTAIARTLASEACDVTFVETAVAALAASEPRAPDVLVVEIGLPGVDDLELISRVRDRWPEVRVVVLTTVAAGPRSLAALRAGACGCLLKEDLDRRFASAIDEALAGGAPMSPIVAQMVIEELRRDVGVPAPRVPPILSGRELAVLELLASGLRYDDVATELAISVNTVRTHVRSIYEKLGVGSRTKAVMSAMRLGILARPRRAT